MPAQQRHDRTGGVLGTWDQHTPAEKRLNLEPIQFLALCHDIADHDDANTSEFHQL